MPLLQQPIICCPKSHPYPYQGGNYCCSTNTDKANVSPLLYNGSNCMGDAYAACPKPGGALCSDIGKNIFLSTYYERDPD
jgi:hypothetical protein